MADSVRMDPLLERQLEQAAKRQGVTKWQFIVHAVERALGRKNPYERMLALVDALHGQDGGKAGRGQVNPPA
jgi:RHH-type rel operon transcriptional repressor/antitoxin RelB